MRIEEETIFSQLATGLEHQGYVVLLKALPETVANCLVALRERQQPLFQPAGVGRAQAQQYNQTVRRDKIAWIEPDDTLAKPWVEWTQRLQRYLNQRFFLGLFSFESHLARYEPGDFYKKHFDAFRGQSNRRVSLVTYLNSSWTQELGGDLCLYHPESGDLLEQVAPEFGTLVLFMSDEFPHEVKPAKQERHSVAGWFRVNTSSDRVVDPPS